MKFTLPCLLAIQLVLVANAQSVEKYDPAKDTMSRENIHAESDKQKICYSYQVIPPLPEDKLVQSPEGQCKEYCDKLPLGDPNKPDVEFPSYACDAGGYSRTDGFDTEYIDGTCRTLRRLICFSRTH